MLSEQIFNKFLEIQDSFTNVSGKAVLIKKQKHREDYELCKNIKSENITMIILLISLLLIFLFRLQPVHCSSIVL